MFNAIANAYADDAARRERQRRMLDAIERNLRERRRDGIDNQ